MNDDIKALKDLKEYIEKDIKSNYLVNPATPELKIRADKIIAKKKKQIQALDNCIQRLEDLYE